MSDSWGDVVRDWLPLVLPGIRAKAVEQAREGGPGVLVLTVDVAAMARLIADPAGPVTYTWNWLPPDAFLEFFSSRLRQGLLEKLSTALAVMNYEQDLALYITNTADPDGDGWEHRIYIDFDGKPPLH
jgi:hypothetical protein